MCYVYVRSNNGSIPACTGEPREWLAVFKDTGVYPRVYGGTQGGGLELIDTPGLSPRVRGNPHRRPAGGTDARSIPACTGEPLL